MLKRFTAMLVVCFLLLPAVTAYADVVWGNDFFDRNRDDTEPMNRYFRANGPNGYVSAKTAPGDAKEQTSYDNGSIILIGSTYLHKGRYWGIPPISHAYSMSGWLLMDELLMIYDHIDFVSEHRHELYHYAGDADRALESEGYYVWRWPGSDMEKRRYSSEYVEAGDFNSQLAYVDNEGREWVYYQIIGGDRLGGFSHQNAASGWICLDDPDNPGIPAFNPAPDPIVWSGQDAPDWYAAPDTPPIDGDGNGGNNGNAGNNGNDGNGGNGDGGEDDDIDNGGTELNVALIVIVATVLLIGVTVVLVIIIYGKRK